MNILIEGWTNYPHSYSSVNVQQIIALQKLGCNIYLHESPPYNEEWKKIDLSGILLSPEEAVLISDLKVFEKCKPKPHIDIIYRIAFPYNIQVSTLPYSTPILLFYTSEFQLLPDNYFCNGASIKSFMNKCFSREIIPITPSKWSAVAVQKEKYDPMVIPHGVDPNKYFPKVSNARKDLNIPQDAFVILNVGAMTPNKNIKAIIKAFYRISLSNENVYLVLKGMEELYKCEASIVKYIRELLSEQVLSIKHWKEIRKRLIYIPCTYTYIEMNDLYNASDVYVSPYLAEGFNIPVLEATACGIPSIIPKGGSTDDFTNTDIAVYPVTISVNIQIGNQSILLVDDISLQDCILQVMNDIKFRQDVKEIGPQYVKENFTWDIVTEKLYQFMKYIRDEFDLIETGKKYNYIR
jgi:glycosyltransferase involved in cell wall biosynthesis